MEYKKLTEIASPKQWKTVSTEMLTENGYPVYGASEIIGYYNDYNHDKPTVTIGCRGTCGKINLVSEKAYINGNAMCIDNLSEDFGEEFLYYYLQQYDFSKVISGSTIPQITIKGLEKVLIPVVSKTEQRDIVQKFKLIDSAVSNITNRISLYDELVKARFVEMFGLPVSNTKGWKTEQMNDVAPTVNYNGDFADEVWLLNLDMVESQTGRILDYLFVSEEDVGNSICTFNTSNVLYSKLRPYLNKVVIPDRCGYATSELVPLQPVASKINREYLAFLLRSDDFVNMINEKVAGAKMPRVSMSDFRKFDVPVPPMELQEQFTEFVHQVDKSKFEATKTLEYLEELKAALMAKYFR